MPKCEIDGKTVHLGDVMGILRDMQGLPRAFYGGIVNILTAFTYTPSSRPGYNNPFHVRSLRSDFLSPEAAGQGLIIQRISESNAERFKGVRLF
jgi:hypothetical protein